MISASCEPRRLQARAAGISAERFYAYRSKGIVGQIARGLYRWADGPEIDQDLLEIAHRAPRGTLCLVTALGRHGLPDIIPPSIDIVRLRHREGPDVAWEVLWGCPTGELIQHLWDIKEIDTPALGKPQLQAGASRKFLSPPRQPRSAL